MLCIEVTGSLGPVSGGRRRLYSGLRGGGSFCTSGADGSRFLLSNTGLLPLHRGLAVEVFTGPIFSTNSSPPHEPGSKSIPPQIQNLMGQPPNPYQSKNCFYPYRVKILIVFVSNPSTLAHICQSIRYNLVSVLLLSRFVKVRCLAHGVKATICPKSNPIHTIFTNCAPFPLHFHFISISIWISTPLKGSNCQRTVTRLPPR